MNSLLLLLALQVPQLPDSSGWGVHVLAIARAPDSAIWVGTYGQGIFVLRKGAGSWERVRSSRDTAAHAISWDFVQAFGFGPRGQVWYGTVGNGWGLSTDGGKTWKNWEFRQLGPEWQYVAPNGIVTRGDTTYIATADGIKVTWDDGQTWRVITDLVGATTARDSVWGRIESQYVLGIGWSRNELSINTVHANERSTHGGRSWTTLVDYEPCQTRCYEWRRQSLNTDSGVIRIGSSLEEDRPELHRVLSADKRANNAPLGGRPSQPRHTWFRRPIALTDQPYIDQTYRFGSTMGGNFQPHQGVEFNNPDGTAVHAIGDGVVVHRGAGGAGGAYGGDPA